nr:MAG TPA_asm: Kti11, Kti13 transfer, tRNA modification, Complex [Caudoviricetes sp.]
MAGTEITVLLWQGFLPFPLSCPCGGGIQIPRRYCSTAAMHNRKYLT